MSNIVTDAQAQDTADFFSSRQRALEYTFGVRESHLRVRLVTY